MKTILSSISALLLLLTSLYAQPSYAPLGSYWNYDYFQHNGFYDATATIRVTNDTLISGEMHKTLTLLEDRYNALPPFQSGQFASAFGHLIYRNDSVFYYDQFPSNERYLYNFHMSLGDTVQIDSFLNLIAVVTLQDSLLVSGQMKKRWTFSKYCNTTFMDSIIVIEDIGPVNDLLTWNSEGCLLGGGDWYFQCYASDSLQFNTPCTPVVVGVDGPKTATLNWSVSPIPAHDHVVAAWDAQMGAVQLTVRDMQMRTLATFFADGEAKMRLDISTLPSGVYWLQLKSGDENDIKRLVKL